MCRTSSDFAARISFSLTRVFPDFPFRKFFYTPSGFVHVYTIDKKYHIRKIADMLAARDPKRFNIAAFYIFGWSGKASFSERKKAAQELYNKLTMLTKEHKQKYNTLPEIRIITHSHGGSVALNLAAVTEEKPSFSIRNLILLACPVQEATKKYIHAPLFEHTYSFFSKLDFLQILDPQGLYRGQGGLKRTPLFSKRVFPEDKKLRQARIRINGRSILHVEFLFRRFISHLPAILDALEERKTTQLTDPPEKKPPHILLINLRKKKEERATG